MVATSGCRVLVDLGAGSGEKVIAALSAQLPSHAECMTFKYVPIDLNEQVLRDCIGAFRDAGLNNPIHAICGVYPDVLEATAKFAEPKLFASFGSSISNQDMPEIRSFLSSIRGACSADDRFLLGVDITEDPGKIARAYNDRNQVNRIHNLNVLNHVNRRHRANFETDNFTTVSEFNTRTWRLETHVVAKTRSKISCLDGRVEFEMTTGDRIRTEISQKFKEAEVIPMVEAAGFKHTASWTDKACHFLLAMFSPAEAAPHHELVPGWQHE